MKSISLCCLVILMSLNPMLMAQVHPMSPEYENSIWNRINGSLAKHAIFKAKQNSSKLNSTISSYWNGVSMEVAAKTEYDYQNDQIASAEYYLKEESDWHKDSKVEYEYNNGLITSITFLNFDGESYIPIYQHKYGYGIVDAGPRLLSELYREFDEQIGWISIEKYDYEYKNGQISGGTEYKWENTQWIELERFDASFKDDTTFIIYSYKESENTIEYSREVYPSFTLSELYDLYFDISTNIFYELTYLSLQFPDYIYQEKVDDVWKNIEGQQTLDYYDSWDGKLKMRDIQHGYWTEEWTVSYNNEIWFNQKTNPDSAIVYVFHEEGKEAAGQEVYRYNEASQLAEVDFLQNIGTGLILQKTTQLNWDVETSVEPKSDILAYKLNPAYPNPFNPTTSINYSIKNAGEIRISVYDILGRHVSTLIDGFQPVGEHKVQFDASFLSSGLYIVRMEAVNFQKSQLITLVK